jgi:hypothetical protein
MQSTRVNVYGPANVTFMQSRRGEAMYGSAELMLWFRICCVDHVVLFCESYRSVFSADPL